MQHEIVLSNKYHITLIEGLDCSGKESLVAELQRRLQEEGHHVMVRDFPRYETEIGKQIRQELLKDPKDRNPLQLQELFRIDREQYFRELAEAPEPEEETYLLLDRCHYSNYLYGILQGHTEEYLLDQLKKESTTLPKIELIFYLGRFFSEAKAIHESLLQQKKDKDANETQVIQETLWNRMKDTYEYLPVLMDIDYHTCISIGSYFGKGGTRFDEDLLTILKDQIIYPELSMRWNLSMELRKK